MEIRRNSGWCGNSRQHKEQVGKTMPGRMTPKGTFQTTSLIAVAVLLLILFVTAGWFLIIPAENESDTNSAHTDALHDNRALWLEQRPPAYSYVIDRDCACDQYHSEPYRAMELTDGKSATFPTHALEKLGDRNAMPGNPVWISDVFRAIEVAISNGTLDEVDYDYTLGHPTLVRIHSNDAGTNWLEIRVQDFQAEAPL